MSRFPLLLALSVGYISLSQEILWVRVFGFVNQGLPQAFAAVLALYLLGIALGANIGKFICGRFPSLYPIAGVILIAAGIFDIAAPIVYSYAADLSLALPLLAILIILTALNKSIMFPIVHHLGTLDREGSVGKNVSQVYFMNVMGSALGPLVTGFILLDYFSVHASLILMGLATILVGVLCLAQDKTNIRKMAGASVAMLFVVTLTIQFVGRNYAVLPEKVIEATTCRESSQIVENKHGIIHICPSENGDIIFGGNVYDGRMSNDPIIDSNGIARLLVVSAIHPRPAKVLVIGLSGAAWLSVLTKMPGVNQIEVVEINSGYLEIIEGYPEMLEALNDPRVHVNIDDGRRWLKNHPAANYDLVLMNTTFSWRSYSTNLLSEEFLLEVKSHLNDGGIVAYNGTGSLDAFYTASHVFSYAYSFSSFIYASESDFLNAEKNPRNRYNVLQTVRALADETDSELVSKLTDSLVETRFRTIGELIENAPRQPEIITDRNMITEYKYGILGEYLRQYDGVWDFITCMTCKKENWERKLE